MSPFPADRIRGHIYFIEIKLKCDLLIEVAYRAGWALMSAPATLHKRISDLFSSVQNVLDGKVESDVVLSPETGLM